MCDERTRTKLTLLLSTHSGPAGCGHGNERLSASKREITKFGVPAFRRFGVECNAVDCRGTSESLSIPAQSSFYPAKGVTKASVE